MLNINRSTLTRWIEKHPALLGDDGLVDPAVLQEHRDSVANPKLQTRGNPVRLSESPSERPAAGNQALNDHRARGEAAKAITAELDLADRLKMTLERSRVESEIAAAGEILKRKASEIAKDRAEPLARIDDPRAMERALEDLMHRLLEQGAKALILAMSPVDSEDDAA